MSRTLDDILRAGEGILWARYTKTSEERNGRNKVASGADGHNPQ